MDMKVELESYAELFEVDKGKRPRKKTSFYSDALVCSCLPLARAATGYKARRPFCNSFF
jgi:hypothetical protein